MYALLSLTAGVLLSGAGLWAAVLATSDPLRTRRWLIAVSAALVALGAVMVLFGIAGLIERFG